MKENKLGTYLTSFTDKDWAAYHKFSKSLYSIDSDYQQVINYIKKNKSRYDPSYMDGEYLRNKIRPGASKQVFANVISNLCKYLEQYLTWAEIENDPMMKDTLLLQALGKRGLTTQFYKQKDKSKKQRSKVPIGLWNGYHEFMAEYFLYYCNMTSEIKVSRFALKEAFNSLKKLSDNLNLYLKLEMHNREILLREDWTNELSSFNEEEFNHEISPIIYHLIDLKINKSQLSYNWLLKQVESEEFSKEIRYTIMVHLRSFISHKTVRGENSYRLKLIELQKYGLESDILFPNGKIPAPRFINIVHRACDMEEYIWASKFIDNYAHRVPNSSFESTKLLGFAQIASSKNRFEKVLELLSNTKYIIFEQELCAKWLILNSNYELNKDNYSIIEYIITNYKYFIKKNKKNTTELTYISHLNTAKYLLKTAKGINLNGVLVKINTEKNIAYRNWLRIKVQEKINKK